MTAKLFLHLCSLCAATSVEAFTGQEHELLSRTVLDSVAGEVGKVSPAGLSIGTCADSLFIPAALMGGEDFEHLTKYFAEDDRARSRFHQPSRTVMEQLAVLTKQQLTSDWEKEKGIT